MMYRMTSINQSSQNLKDIGTFSVLSSLVASLAHHRTLDAGTGKIRNSRSPHGERGERYYYVCDVYFI
jgi:hypothetical protein